VRKLKPGAAPSPQALRLVGEFAPPAGCEVVPKPEAQALVQYLLSLKSDAVFYEVFPTPPPKKSTNAVDAAMEGTNAAPADATTNSTVPSAAATNPPPAR
jgi:hypothetical protein